MCCFEKCYSFLPVDILCVLLGCLTFILSLPAGIASVVLLAFEKTHHNEGTLFMKQVMSLEMNTSSLNIVFCLISIIAAMWMFFSVMLVIGIIKNRASFVLSYFSFGIIVTILMMLSALLVLLNFHWIYALVGFLAALFYVHCLIMVHNTYELMQRGKIFRWSQTQEANEDLIETVA